MYRIVVGVDESKEARRAVDWALEQAAGRNGSVHLVHTFELPVPVAAYRFGGVVMPADLETRAREGAAHFLKSIADELTPPEGVEVTWEVDEAVQPAKALIARSEEADLLVVGSRGHGGFGGLLLGSVSQQCVHHAACPIVVVR